MLYFAANLNGMDAANLNGMEGKIGAVDTGNTQDKQQAGRTASEQLTPCVLFVLSDTHCLTHLAVQIQDTELRIEAGDHLWDEQVVLDQRGVRLVAEASARLHGRWVTPTKYAHTRLGLLIEVDERDLQCISEESLASRFQGRFGVTINFVFTVDLADMHVDEMRC